MRQVASEHAANVLFVAIWRMHSQCLFCNLYFTNTSKIVDLKSIFHKHRRLDVSRTNIPLLWE